MTARSGITNWRLFQTGTPRQKGSHETCHFTVLSLLPYIFELEEFPSYSTQESPRHPKLPPIESLGCSDLSSLCYFPRSFVHLFYQHALRAHSL